VKYLSNRLSRHHIHHTGLALTATLLLATCGCAPKPSGPETCPVTGVVTLDGQPVEDADITFHASSPDAKFAGGYAVTDAEGSYAAAIFVDGGRATQEGLPPGEYAVAIVKLESVPGDANLTAPPRNVLPAKYDSQKTSGLSIAVSAEGPNRHDFSLQKSP
jgi:hypothetical protein